MFLTLKQTNKLNGLFSILHHLKIVAIRIMKLHLIGLRRPLRNISDWPHTSRQKLIERLENVVHQKGKMRITLMLIPLGVLLLSRMGSKQLNELTGSSLKLTIKNSIRLLTRNLLQSRPIIPIQINRIFNLRLLSHTQLVDVKIQHLIQLIRLESDRHQRLKFHAKPSLFLNLLIPKFYHTSLRKRPFNP